MLILTGASRGVGKFLFEKYAEKEPIIGTYNTTSNGVGNFKYGRMVKMDICNYEDVEQFFTSIEEELECLTLINCAGISYNAFAHKSDPANWKKVIDTNLIGSYHLIRALLPIMRKQKYGRIVNFASVVAQKATPGVSAYAASKAALWGMSKSIAQENGSLNITINNINLGYVKVGMGVEQVPDSYQEIIKKQVPNGEFCEPDDIYQTLEYLRNTAYINGTSIDLNGGLI